MYFGAEQLLVLTRLFCKNLIEEPQLEVPLSHLCPRPSHLHRSLTAIIERTLVGYFAQRLEWSG